MYESLYSVRENNFSINNPMKMGFTLIELSIVLVIIGLVVGGVLVGQNLVAASEIRAQISQIEKYNQAVNNFRNKYNAMPGDMSVANAQTFGFTVGANCLGTPGRRDGNGIIDGYAAAGVLQGGGETGLFWEDLSSVNMIEGNYPADGTAFSCGANGAAVASGATLGLYFPTAKIGRSNYLYVYEVGGKHFYGLSAVSSNTMGGAMFSGVSLPVMTAYNIDSKIDDSLPLTGNVITKYINNTSVILPASASPAIATSCYDSTASSGNYAITVRSGAGTNCALSIGFQ